MPKAFCRFASIWPRMSFKPLVRESLNCTKVDKDAFGRPVYGRAKFPVKPEVLKKIAADTGGEAYIANQTEELRSSMHSILDKLQKTRFEAASGDVVERFPLVLFPGVALVLIEAVLRALILRRFP